MENFPHRLAMSPDVCAVLDVLRVPQRTKSCAACVCAIEPVSESGIRVVISMTAPMEFPAYAAENGPYMTSMREIAEGDTSPQRGPPMVLLFAMSAESGTPSAKMRLRALELTPHTRVPNVACVSPLLRF